MDNFSNKINEENDYNKKYTDAKNLFEEIKKEVDSELEMMFNQEKENWATIGSINEVNKHLINLLESFNEKKASEFRKKLNK
jgi:hypothetical protein